MVVMSFEERLGREDLLLTQPLTLAPGVGASRAPGLAHTQQQLSMLRGPGRQEGDEREGKHFAVQVEVSRVCWE